MASSEIWPAIAGERQALADDLATISAEQWDQPSLCEGWSVRDVVAHMTATAKTTPPSFFAKLIGSGFRFNRMAAKDIQAERGASPDDTLTRFRAEVNSTKHPPGPVESWLGEALIHSEDVRRPLGIIRDYPTETAVRVADFYKGSNLIVGAKRRIAGLRLAATDAEWVHGAGPEVRGPIVSIVMAMTGRTAALADLTGEGVETLRTRAS